MNDRIQTDTHEQVFEALTAWLREPKKSRELKIETIGLDRGLHCKLLESGIVQAEGRGTSSDDAIANALEALLDAEAAEDERAERGDAAVQFEPRGAY